jgi:hypothetical protein
MTKTEIQTLLGLLAIYVLAPIVIARWFMHASWQATFISMALWYGALLMFGLAAAKSLDEAVGWAMILGLFFTIFVTPVIILILRAFGIR